MGGVRWLRGSYVEEKIFQSEERYCLLPLVNF